MSSLRLAFLVLAPTAAVVVAASCTPIVRPAAVESGGSGGVMATSLSGALTTGAVMTTSTEATSGTDATATTTGMPSTSSGACPDTQTDPSNCGVCGHDCSTQANPGVATCLNGVCAFTCAPGFFDCNVGAEDGCETDGTIDPKNCNGCGSVCGLTQTCAASSCMDTFTSCAASPSCVDPTCEEPNRFSVDAEVAVDLMNGKVLWQRLSKGPIDFTTASDYCATSSFSGIMGWRLPTQAELASLLYNAGGQDGCATPNCGPAVDQSVFIDSFSDDYWTTDPGIPDGHLCVSFCTGFSLTYTTTDHYARCTHDPL